MCPDIAQSPDDLLANRDWPTGPIEGATTSDDTLPDVDTDVDSILSRAISMRMSSSKGGGIELRFLFAAMLQGTNPVQRSLHELLERRGASLSEVSRTTDAYVLAGNEKIDYAATLKNKHRFELRPVDIPNYKSDQSRKIDLSHDLVGIRAEVESALGLSLIVEGLEGNHFNNEKTRLEDWLTNRKNWKSVTSTRLAPIVTLAERFLFRVGGRNAT